MMHRLLLCPVDVGGDTPGVEAAIVRVMAWLTVRQNILEDQRGEVGELDEGEGIGGC